MTQLQVLFGWNSFQSCIADSCNNASVQESGVLNWTDANIIISIFFYVATSGIFDLSVTYATIQRQAQLQVSIPALQKSFVSNFKSFSSSFHIGNITVVNPGYYEVQFQPTNNQVNKNLVNFPDLNALSISTTKDASNFYYVQKNFSSNYGRRGPSVHLDYQLDYTNGIKQFFNQVTVPNNYDTVGTFAMAIGFSYGYLGMQVNSLSERRFIFSVWSPQNDDDPSKILLENAVINLALGPNAQGNSFGGEGSGGQSYVVYPWVAGVAYQFKLEGKPDVNGTSVFSGYYKDPTKPNSQFVLIATWRRQKTQSYLNNISSFLENFDTETGHISRMAYYNKQIAVDTKNKTVSVNSAVFTLDDTGLSQQRLDYNGGVVPNQGYYLQNCGFFNPTQVREGDLFQIQNN